MSGVLQTKERERVENVGRNGGRCTLRTKIEEMHEETRCRVTLTGEYVGEFYTEKGGRHGYH